MDKGKIIQNQYDRMALSYDTRWKSYTESSLRILESRLHFKGDEKILDVGCGTAVLEERLMHRHPELNITGIDLSREMLVAARNKLAVYPNIIFKEAAASRLPFENESFDWVVSASAFHYFDQPVRTLHEMRRVLKPGGKVLILDWCKDYLVCRICDFWLKIWDPSYRQCYRLKECRRFFKEAHFNLQSESRFRFMMIWGMMLVEGVKRD